MEHSNPIPLTLEEVCGSGHTAVLAYDLQEGIFSQAHELRSVIPNVVAVLSAARTAQRPVFFSRHTSPPKELMGVSQLRTAMIWQRAATAKAVRPRFLPGSPEARLIPETKPTADEQIFDKVGMSFFEGTPLNTALRDLGVNAVLIVGVVLEIGILPTVLHALDLGYMPVVVADACGSVSPEVRKYVLAYLEYTGTVLITDTATAVRCLGKTAT